MYLIQFGVMVASLFNEKVRKMWRGEREAVKILREKVDPLLELGKDVLIVGHGAMNSSIVCQKKNLPIEKFWSEGIENCKLMRLC